ncbi:MAG: PilZ domain-containing protein [Desulfosarcina sp.]
MGVEGSDVKLERGAVVRLVGNDTDPPVDGLFIGTDATGDWIVVPLSEKGPHPTAADILHGQCLCKNQMVAFVSELMEVIHHPVTLWRIQTPADVKEFDLRDHKRIQCSVAARIQALERGRVVAGIIQDISKSGGRCILRSSDAEERPFEPGESIILRCAFPGVPGEQAVSGTITEVVKTGEEVSIGIRFVESAMWVPPYH